MSLYIPVLQTKFYLKRLLDSPKLQQLLAAGVLDMKPLDELGKRFGDYFNIPTMYYPADFARFDYASSTPNTGTPANSNDYQFPFLWADSVNSFQDTDVARTGEDISRLWSERLGEKVAKRFLYEFGNMLAGAVPAALTNNQTGLKPTVQMIRNTKYLAGDQADDFTTLVCHSNVWSALLYDMLKNYSANPSIAGVAFDGSTAAILGCDKIIISDQMPDTPSGFATQGDNIFSTFLVRENGIKFGYQMEPNESRWTNTTLPGNVTYVKYQTSFVMGLEGVTFSGGANPTDAALATPGNWNPAYQDLREVSAVQLISAGIANNAS